jgi:hypothetical protein
MSPRPASKRRPPSAWTVWSTRLPPLDRITVSDFAGFGDGRLGLAPRRIARAADGPGRTRRAGWCPPPEHRQADEAPAGRRRRRPALSPRGLGQVALQRQMRAGFRNAEAFWRDATQVPGMTAHHAEMTRFFARQAGRDGARQLAGHEPGGAAGRAGIRRRAPGAGPVNWLARRERRARRRQQAEAAAFEVGRDVAVTPGKVVLPQPPDRADPLRRRRRPRCTPSRC